MQTFELSDSRERHDPHPRRQEPSHAVSEVLADENPHVGKRVASIPASNPLPETSAVGPYKFANAPVPNTWYRNGSPPPRTHTVPLFQANGRELIRRSDQRNPRIVELEANENPHEKHPRQAVNPPRLRREPRIEKHVLGPGDAREIQGRAYEKGEAWEP